MNWEYLIIFISHSLNISELNKLSIRHRKYIKYAICFHCVNIRTKYNKYYISLYTLTVYLVCI